MKNFIVVIVTVFYWSIDTSAQETIPIGTWRTHVSYNSIHSVALGNDRVYAATRNGVMALDLNDKSISSNTKLTGLSGADISVINYDKATNQLLIAYADGNLDLIKNNLLTNFDNLKSSTAIAGSKRINAIVIRSGFAYLAADYGVVIFDLQRQEVKETWRDLGAGGTALKIFQGTFKGDSIFLATEKGLLAGDLQSNLLDFSNWKRFQQGAFNTTIQSVASFNSKVYAALSGSGIYRYENGTWTKETFLPNSPLQHLSAGNNLFIKQDTKVWKLDTSNKLTEVTSSLFMRPQDMAEDENGKLWIGDAKNGLVSDVEGTFIKYLPDGPTLTDVFRLTAHNGSVTAIGGGYSKSFLPLANVGDINTFSSAWTSELSPLNDIVDVDFRGNEPLAATFGQGVQAGKFSAPDIIFTNNNSTLVGTGGAVNTTAIKNSSEGVWVANYGVDPPLHLLTSDNSWQSFSFISSASRYPLDLAVDLYGSVWMLLDPGKGGGIQVFSKEQNKSAYLLEIAGAGGLPSRNARSIAVDRDGYVWIGTDQGVTYFPNPFGVFGSNVDGIEPIFESRYLLSDQRITAIAIDGGNRKWIGTEKGVWLFSPTAEEVVYNFTQQNSPLLSDVIRDIAINSQTGEVFFATNKGIVSFRSDATESDLSFNNVKIFPNPVTSDYTGTIGITGLATDAIVKITDVSGKLVWQTQANGGTATWNAKNHNGKRAVTGVYLVFSATQDGAENFVGKIAVIE